MLPGPEGLEAVALYRLLQLVLLVDLDRVADHFDVGDACFIVPAHAKVLDASETRGQLRIAGHQHVLHVFNGLACEQILLQHHIALVAALFRTPDQLLNEWTHLLGLLEGGGDALVCEEVGGEVAEHGLAVLVVAAKLANRLLVPHYYVIINIIIY